MNIPYSLQRRKANISAISLRERNTERSKTKRHQKEPGTYKLIQHGKVNFSRHQKTTTIQLNKNHTISGRMTGTWQKTGKKTQPTSR
ncbi:lipocalin-like domain-containing protein [Bacillus subtilis]|uniref:lipocalin-like domain-containing protein n=1 Tax=Bacillus subtilis TaxID=1423 RepID=UPI00339D2AEE